MMPKKKLVKLVKILNKELQMPIKMLKIKPLILLIRLPTKLKISNKEPLKLIKMPKIKLLKLVKISSKEPRT
jgi:hypothetical protein